VSNIKICGLFREADIDFANEAGPDFIGFVFAESRRRVSPAQAARLRSRLREGIVPVGVFVNAPAEEIAALYRDGLIGMAQLHGNEDAAYIRRLKTLSASGGPAPVPVIKVLRIGGPEPAAGEDGGHFIEEERKNFNHGEHGEHGARKENTRSLFSPCSSSVYSVYSVVAFLQNQRDFIDEKEINAFALGEDGGHFIEEERKNFNHREHWLGERAAAAADYLLFDSGAGGGKPFDWNLLNAASVFSGAGSAAHPLVTVTGFAGGDGATPALRGWSPGGARVKAAAVKKSPESGPPSLLPDAPKDLSCAGAVCGAPAVPLSFRQHAPACPYERPWFIAGGVDGGNIEKALALGPFGIDVSSGAETGGVKDREKMIALVRRVKEARYE
jgi:phosphoribosylanthranilate isomerase